MFSNGGVAQLSEDCLLVHNHHKRAAENIKGPVVPFPSMVADLVLGSIESIITCDEFTTAFQKVDNRIHVHTGC